MAIFKPGRLRRVLTPIIGNAWLFALYTPSLGAYEDVITGIKIHRGTTGRNVGHHASTVEVGLNGRFDALSTGELMRVLLRNQTAAALAAFVGGGATAANIETRFEGRFATVDIEDTGRRFETTIAGASWLAQMNYSTASFTPIAGESLAALYADMTKSDEPLRGISFGTVLGTMDMRHFAAGESMLFREGVEEIAADIGVLFQERRDGVTYAYSHVKRRDLALSRVITDFPLMRSQAVAPGKYEQSNAQPAKRVEFKIINEQGGPAVRTAEIANPSGELRENEVVDWSRWQVTAVDNQLYREAYARVHESSSRLYQLPTVKVDMLMLLQNGGTYAKQIASQILRLEVGEPIALSGDWPGKLQGVHFAEGITETVTPDEWTFELSLVPHIVATGYGGPTVRPRAWDSANYNWDIETRKWDEF